MRRFVQRLVLLCFLAPGGLFAQSEGPCTCCTEAHDDFDFWLGHWEVRDTTGTVVGENRIEKLEAGCLISERWIGAKTSTGRSYNYFNPTDSLWHQHWIDNSGLILDLSGGLIDDKMVLSSPLLEGTSIKLYRHQISWQPKEDGSVIQRWALLGPNNELLQLLFHGIYTPKSAD